MNTIKPTPLRVTTSHEMREIDSIADKDFGIDASLLMENAGRAAAQVILEEYPRAGIETEVLVFAGKGNNAGDAFVVARRLLCLDRRVRVFLLESPERYQGATLKNYQILKSLKAKIAVLEAGSDLEAFFSSSNGPFTIIDGILGTGLRGPIDGLFFDVVELINKAGAEQVIALDIPTGVNGDSGAVHGSSIQADLTISFGFPKVGHFFAPGATKRGQLINVDISLPPRFRREGDKFLLMKHPMKELLSDRDRYGHKNSFGHTLLIGGSRGRLGAIIMASRAAHKMGTGLVTTATWENAYEMLLNKLPAETMAVPIRLSGTDLELYRRSLGDYSSIVLGPGLGTPAEGKALVEELLAHYRGPVVLDADALNLIADHQLFDRLTNRRAPTVLTPHPGEMARLLGISKEEVSADPVKAIRDCVRKTHAVVLLKGAATLIGNEVDRLFLNHYPNDGMATAGSGDVLAGMIGGLLGQKMDPFQATLLGVYLHSLAGDHAAEKVGHRSMTAADIIENISEAFKDLKNSTPSNQPVEGRARLL